MTSFEFPVVFSKGNGVASVTAYNEQASEPFFMATENHPYWDEILDGLRRGDPDVWELFNIADSVMRKFREVTDRVSYDGQNVLFDGDPQDGPLAEHFSRIIENGASSEQIKAVALFWEKLESNPNEHSRKQAYDFLASHKFQITAEGDVVGFKGVSKTAGGYQSWAASESKNQPAAYVDGKPLPPEVRVIQDIGSVVTMPRAEVVHDPSKHCSRGLHVATKNYANGYGDTILEVHVNPRDIVSVPNDAGGEKVRVCRYVVAKIADDVVSDAPVLSNTASAAPVGNYVGYDGI